MMRLADGDAKLDLRERLAGNDDERQVPATYNYSLATSECYAADSSVGHVGRYRAIRESLDQEYHGTYSHSRQSLQDDLIDAASAGVAGGKAEPWIIFSAGAMGSGKSRTFQFLVDRNIVPLQQVQILDSDVFKSSLPEWSGYLAADPLSAGFRTRRESGYLMEIALEAALQRRRHIWVDGSLRDGEWYAKEFGRILQQHPGYRIGILHVVASRATVLQRVDARAAVTGRHVPLAEIDDSITRVPASVRRLSPLVDFLAVVDNSAENQPHLVEYCDRGECRLCIDEWSELAARFECEDDIADEECVVPLQVGDEVEWERSTKNFELARRTSQSGRAEEWG